MEDLGKYSYLIFLLIYLIYSFFSKSKKVKGESQPQQEKTEGKSFEDILRDIITQTTSQKEPKTKPQNVKETLANKANRETMKVEKMQAPKLINIEKKIYNEEPLEVVELETHHSIIDEIHSGDFDFRKAIILSEIMQRPRYV